MQIPAFCFAGRTWYPEMGEESIPRAGIVFFAGQEPHQDEFLDPPGRAGPDRDDWPPAVRGVPEMAGRSGAGRDTRGRKQLQQTKSLQPEVSHWFLIDQS